MNSFILLPFILLVIYFSVLEIIRLIRIYNYYKLRKLIRRQEENKSVWDYIVKHDLFKRGNVMSEIMIGDKVIIINTPRWGRIIKTVEIITGETPKFWKVGVHQTMFNKQTLLEKGGNRKLSCYNQKEMDDYKKQSKIDYYRQVFRSGIDVELSNRLSEYEVLKFADMILSLKNKYLSKTIE